MKGYMPLRFHYEEGSGGVSQPGTEGAPGDFDAGSSSVGTVNTEGQHGGPPDTIPYPRFKEVNDQLAELRPFREFTQAGYDADSLRRLAELDAAYDRDPVGTWLQVAKSIETLPEPLRAAIASLEEEPSSHPATNGGAPMSTTNQQSPAATSTDDPPAWAKPLLEDHQRRAQESEEATQQQMIEEVIEKWTQADKAAGIKTPPRTTMLTMIAGNAAIANDLDELVKLARGEALALREHWLSSELKKPGDGNQPPRSVPGGETPLTNRAEQPKTLAGLRSIIEADVREGRL